MLTQKRGVDLVMAGQTRPLLSRKTSLALHNNHGASVNFAFDRNLSKDHATVKTH